MLKRFKVKNFKNFKDEISFDFSSVAGYHFSEDCISDKLISKLLVYGRNAVGKTNLGRAFGNITNLFNINIPHDNFLNADSESDRCEFEYIFTDNEKEVTIRYSLNEMGNIMIETMLIENKIIYDIDFLHGEFNFDNISKFGIKTLITETYKNMYNSLNNNIDGNKSSYPFFKWLLSNYILDNNSVFYKIRNDIEGMYFIDGSTNWGRFPKYNQLNKLFLDQVELKKFESFLNDMGVKCKLVSKKLPDGTAELYFKYKKLVPFHDNVSSGTYGLVKLYETILSMKNPKFIYYDEFDAFDHYELSENVLKYLKKNYPTTQIILTTHNTNLMNNEIMRPDCVAILSTDGRLTQLHKATNRELREGHNLEKMYISGEFEKYE